MSQVVYLVRHAIAEDRSPSGRDADRRLTEEGVDKMRRASAGLARLGVAPSVVCTSPLQRARHTAQILCEVLAPDVSPRILPELAPGRARDVPEALRALGAGGDVALVGHEPDLGDLAAMLAGFGASRGGLAFKKGGVAAVEVDRLPPRAPGVLLWLLTPRQLRALGGEPPG